FDIDVTKRRTHIKTRHRFAHRPESRREAQLLISTAAALSFGRVQCCGSGRAPKLTSQVDVATVDLVDRSTQLSKHRDDLRVNRKHRILSFTPLSEVPPSPHRAQAGSTLRSRRSRRSGSTGRARCDDGGSERGAPTSEAVRRFRNSESDADSDADS